MKKQLKNTVAFLAMALAMVSCTNNDDALNNVSGKGNLNVEFDNIFSGADLILGTQANATSQAEVLKISSIKYIVSNVVLTKEDGSTFVYPKSDSYFIVNEANEDSHLLQLQNLPAGNYTKISFGIGVDQEQYTMGATGQGNLLQLAEAEEMLWSWSAGYKFVAFEGTFTSQSVTNDTPFMVHTGKTGTDYNYATITLNLPDKAIVRNTITPQIHILADVSKIIDGTNKIKLSDNNMGGMGAMIMSGASLPLITENLNGMFEAHHVHND